MGWKTSEILQHVHLKFLTEAVPQKPVFVWFSALKNGSELMEEYAAIYDVLHACLTKQCKYQ